MLLLDHAVARRSDEEVQDAQARPSDSKLKMKTADTSKQDSRKQKPENNNKNWTPKPSTKSPSFRQCYSHAAPLAQSKRQFASRTPESLPKEHGIINSKKSLPDAETSTKAMDARQKRPTTIPSISTRLKK
jgi:hypothetical protein